MKTVTCCGEQIKVEQVQRGPVVRCPKCKGLWRYDYWLLPGERTATSLEPRRIA